MKKFISFFGISVISIILLIGCEEPFNPIDTKLAIEMSLQPAIDLGYNVSRVEAVITKNGFSDNMDLQISGNSASGTFTNLESGEYTIGIYVYQDTSLIASGTGIGYVIGGQTTTVTITINFTGSLTVQVTWGTLWQGLVAFYPFNGNANDESGNGNNGTVSGAMLTVDRFNTAGRAMSFDGTNSKIIVPHNSILHPTNAISISAWVSFASLTSTSSILGKGSDGQVGWYSLRYEATGQTIDFQINFSDYVPGPRATVSINSPIQTNIWYHIVGVFNGSTMKVSLNGYFVNSLSVPKILGGNNEELLLGSCVEGYYLNGKLDDIRIYNRALSEAEILDLYHEDGW